MAKELVNTGIFECQHIAYEYLGKDKKALSWALRELSKRDKKPVEDFIKKYENRLSKRVLREVKHKLEKGTKN